MTSVPQTTQILVIGGGPGGSTAATLLARQGYDVTLLERSHFPRYHIGESLLPTVLQILDLIGAREKVERLGFTCKHGAFLEWGADSWALNFGELSGSCTYAFQVERDEFDHVLLEHARSQGVKVFEGIEVRSLEFDGDRPRKALFGPRAGSVGAGARKIEGEIAFDYLIDASGRAGVMATKYLQNRRYHKVFQNVAIWGYWKGANRMATGREGDIACSAIPNGWIWAIPLRDDVMSMGVVMHKDTVVARRSTPLEVLYMEAINETPLMKGIVDGATPTSKIYTEQDYSYASERFCGPGYFMVGDAACFLDPLLSSGVHLATLSGLVAAAAIGSTLRGEVTAGEAASFFEKCYRQAYLRFLVFLSAFYDVGRKKESYFWEAQRLTAEDAEASDIKMAFLNLVTGIKDLRDAQSDAHRLVLDEMTKRIDENLTLRRDKLALAAGAEQERAAANGRFFSSVEGLFALNEAEAIEGLYISISPRVHLARARAPVTRPVLAPDASAVLG